ncbi:MAG: hypothetical protein JWR51_4352 [Devosia sp.]|nr:hypothetical protein [Devosia sp.]
MVGKASETTILQRARSVAGLAIVLQIFIRDNIVVFR